MVRKLWSRGVILTLMSTMFSYSLTKENVSGIYVCTNGSANFMSQIQDKISYKFLPPFCLFLKIMIK